MHKIATYAFIAALAVSGAASAETAMQQQQDNADAVKADAGAIQKDDNALGKDNADLAKDRSHKAAAKANGSYGKQAASSLAIGADKTAITEKKAEKGVDKKIMSHDAKKVNTSAQQESGTNSTTSN